MGISGNIKTMVLAELLQWLSQGQKTGTLVIDNDKVEKKIFFENGLIISSAATDPKEYLGNFLVSHGYLTEEQVNEAVARQKEEKQLLGQILVNMEAISEDDLHQMLQLKAEESIYDIFTWPEGDFHFLDHELPEETMIRMQLDVQWIVLEGSRRLDEWNHLREAFPSPLTIPVSVVDLAQIEDAEETDMRLFEYVDDKRTVEEISQAAHTSLFQVCQALMDQVQLGRIKTVEPRTIEVEKVVEVEVEKIVEVEKRVEVQVPAQQAPVQQPVYASAPAPAPVPAPAAPPTPSGVNVGGQPLNFAGSGQAAQQPPAQQAPPSQASSPPPSSGSQAGQLAQEAEGQIQSGQLAEALATLKKAKEAGDATAEAERKIQTGEEKLRKALESDGVTPTSVPKLKCSMDELMNLDISPQEGFMLTRVDGSYNIQAILKMSPMPKLEALTLFWKLKNSGDVAL